MGKRKSTMVELVTEMEKTAFPLELMSLYQETICESKAGEYHDFKNEKYACGKVEVVGRLRRLGMTDLAQRVIDGEFDEEADHSDLERMRNDVIMNTNSKAEANAIIKTMKLGEPI